MRKTQKTKVFENIFFNKLSGAIEKTLDRLAERNDWKIEKYEKKETGKWVVQALPEHKIIKFHFLPKGAYKKLIITVSGHRVSAECADNWPKFTFDFLNRKKKILNKFFKELEAILAKDFSR